MPGAELPLWKIALFGLAFMLVLEGAIYALVPGGMKRLLEMLRQMPDAALRNVGWWTLGTGLVLLYFLARFT